MSVGSEKFCTFEAAGRLFGVPLMDIKEVTAEINCTAIPHAPSCVRGYVNIRGQIILGLDLRELLRLPNDQDTRAQRLVIFKTAIGPAFGLLVDEVGDVATNTLCCCHDERSQKLGPTGSVKPCFATK